MVLTEFFISAVKIGVPGDLDDIRSLISTFNSHAARLPVQIAPLEYSEFTDTYDDVEEFMHDQFAEVLGDHWTLVNLLHRNGVNEQVREFHAFLDQFVLATDCVDAMDVLDL